MWAKKLVLICISCVGIAHAQEGFQIKGNIKNLSKTPLVLAHYFGTTQYIPKDTVVTDTAGNFVFSDKNPLPEGFYMVVRPQKGRLLDLIIDKDQTFSFETDSIQTIAAMKIEGSAENELFYQYQQQSKNYNDEIGAIQLQQRMRNDAFNKQLYQTKIDGIRGQSAAHYQQFTKENAASLTVKFLNANAEVSPPQPIKNKEGKVDSLAMFQYYQTHFWDNFDFNDERLVRTPFLERKLKRYMEQAVYPVPDSLIAAADNVINKAIKGNQKELISYCIWFLTNKYETHDMLGHDVVFVHLAEKYYLGGIMPIVNATTIETVQKKVAILKPLLPGNPMPLLTVSDTLQKPFLLTNIKAKYTVVYFYDPKCSNCRLSMPKLKEFYANNKKRGVAIVAISVTRSPDEWKKFIQEFGIQEWYHGYDYSFRTDYRTQFDLVNTPMTYILDDKKNILAKKVPANQLEDFLNFLEQ